MVRYRILLTILTLAAFASPIAQAAALVGESRRVPVAPAPAPAADQLKALYARPDTIPFPAQNPYTPEKAMLGRMLYHDTRLSGSGAIACASCHDAGFGYGNGMPLAIEDSGKPSRRRSPSIINGAWGDTFRWDGGAHSLEEQVIAPIVSPAEMDEPLDHLIHALTAIHEYQTLFAEAFSNQAITPGEVAAAIATYERTIVSSDAPFDAWIEGDQTAVPDAAKRGFDLFNAKGRCASCHSGWRFTDEGFHDIGLPDADNGRGALMPHVKMMQHAFKTPGLREIARRGPYMHNGSLPTLEAVVAHYNHGGVSRTSRSELVAPLDLSSNEQADIVEFLLTLTSAVRPDVVSPLPR